MNIVFSTNSRHGLEVAAMIVDCSGFREYQRQLKDKGSNELIEAFVSHENQLTEVFDKLLNSGDHFQLRVNLEALLTKVYRAGRSSVELEVLMVEEHRKNLEALQTKKQEFWL